MVRNKKCKFVHILILLTNLGYDNGVVPLLIFFVSFDMIKLKFESICSVAHFDIRQIGT